MYNIGHQERGRITLLHSLRHYCSSAQWGFTNLLRKGTHIIGYMLQIQSIRLLRNIKLTSLSKIATGDEGGARMSGEFASSTEIYRLMPTFIPKPVACGKLQQSTIDTTFFLCEHGRIQMAPIDTLLFTSYLADLHRRGTSDSGLFGFPVVTGNGGVFQNVPMQLNWGAYFGSLLKCIQIHDTAVNGQWNELDHLIEKTISDVIPKLLGPLQTNGRSLTPCLIHGNIHGGNLGKDSNTGAYMVWDASCLYAHNEMELGPWRYHKKMKGFIQPYLHSFPPSEPKEQFDDRNRLYSVRSFLNTSVVKLSLQKVPKI